MKDEGRFWDRIAKRYYRSPIKDADAYQHKLTVSRSFFNPETQVLEFGCGTGGTAISHAPHVKHIHAIDVSERMLDYARAQANDKDCTNVSFEKASIESFSAPEASYDVILGMSILHLLDNRDAVLEKVFRLLKPGGVFISSTACMGDNLMLFKYIIPVGRALGLFPIVKVFKQEQLAKELQAHGFTLKQQWRPEKKMAAFIVAEKEVVEGRTAIESDTKYQRGVQNAAVDYINIVSHS